MKLFAAAAIAAVVPSLASAQDLSNLPVPLQCVGSEPFWALKIDGKTGAFTSDFGNQSWKLRSVQTAAMRPSTWRVTFEGDQVRAYIFDEGGKCSDSDSDEPPPLGLLFENGDSILRGCCHPGP